MQTNTTAIKVGFIITATVRPNPEYIGKSI
jgi:hypothetical protein